VTICWSCGEKMEGVSAHYHERCLLQLFGSSVLPQIDVDLARLHTLALATVGRGSISGVQRKLSLRLVGPRNTLQVALDGASYLLKPQAGTFPNLPENEWLTQRLAALLAIKVPCSALLTLGDGSLAYVVRRFDRTGDGRKRGMEDFCQLAELPPAEKYSSSAEKCGQLVRRFASEPLVEMLNLYRQFVFAWWVGNGDMHLKNLSLLRDDDATWRLSPAYDQLNTRLVIPDDHLALPVCGKRDNLKAKTLLDLGKRFGLGEKAIVRVLREVVDVLPAALALVIASPLPSEMRECYCDLLAMRAPQL